MPETLVPDDLSEDQLKWGYWFVTHKIMLRRILSVALIVADAAMVGYSGYGLVNDYLNAQLREKQLAELSRNQLNPAVTASQSAKPLAVSNPQILTAGGKYDFVAKVVNPNKDFVAHFSYRFVAGSSATDFRQGFVLPGDQKFVAELGATEASRPSGVSLEIGGVDWSRVDKHDIPDWRSYAQQHLDFPVTDAAYTADINLGTDQTKVGRTSFTIANHTGFGYYGLRCLVLMYRGSALAAVNSTVFPTFSPSEIKTGEVTWFEDYGAITDIKVQPEVDITDQKAYFRAI